MEELFVLIGLALLTVPVLLIVCLVMVFGLRRRVRELEAATADLQVAQRNASASWQATPAQTREQTPGVPADEPVGSTPPPAAPYEAPARATPAADGLRPAVPPPLPPAPSREAWRDAVAVAPAGRDAASPAHDASDPDAVQRGLRLIGSWFTSGNLPVKIGMLVLFAGVAALLKHASDEGWLAVPVALRLAGVAAAAIGGLLFAWRRRDSHRTFALSLQGGMIGVLLLVVFAAYREFALLEAVPAFSASVALVAGAGVLAVLQNARALAVFAVLAGFLAPIWLSTGSGNHVALFAYYAVLNLAILSVAWFRQWRVLNLLGFVFTFGIGTLWGVLAYDPVHYRSTQPFLVLFFVIYLLIPWLDARRRAAAPGALDGTLVFGTPLVAFSLQAGLMPGEPLALALCALGVSALYAALAWARLRMAPVALLGRSYALLAVGFATLAVPLALTAQATACVFALEGAALVWLGVRQGRRLPQFIGAGLQLAAVVAFVIAADVPAHRFGGVRVHGQFVAALLIALSALASAAAWRGASRLALARCAYGWALAWWLGAWLFEFAMRLPERLFPDAALGLLAVTGWLAAEAHRRRPDIAMGLTPLAFFAVAAPLAGVQALAHGHPFGGRGAIAWALFAVLGLRTLVCLRGAGGWLASTAQGVWWLVWALVGSLLLRYVGERTGLAEGWRHAALVAPWLAIAIAAQWRSRWLAAPIGAAFDTARPVLQAVVCSVVVVWWCSAIVRAGDSAPLPWIALLNPLDVAQVAALLVWAGWLGSGSDGPVLGRVRAPVLAIGGFVLLTVITLRAAHHWGGVPWSGELASSSLAQSSLTVVWSVLGVLGWIIGSRRGHRVLWLAGAVLMGVVLAKLVLVDRGHLGNLWGIGAFIAYGLLCTVVGFFAPAPPKAPAAAEQVPA